MSFRFVPKSVTLNDLERRNGVILRCFSEFGYLPGALRKSSRSLSHLLMSSCPFILVVGSYFNRIIQLLVLLTELQLFKLKITTKFVFTVIITFKLLRFST